MECLKSYIIKLNLIMEFLHNMVSFFCLFPAVTLAKGIGNGFPLAAVVTTPGKNLKSGRCSVVLSNPLPHPSPLPLHQVSKGDCSHLCWTKV